MPNDYLNNPVPFRLSSIMENYFCFCKGEDDHAASPHVQGVSPRGPISKKKAPSAISMNTSLSHDTGSRTKLKIDRRVRGLGLPILRLSLSCTPLVTNFPIRATQAAGPPTREPNPQDACLCSETRLRYYRSKTRMTNPTDLHHLAVSLSIRQYLPSHRRPHSSLLCVTESLSVPLPPQSKYWV